MERDPIPEDVRQFLTEHFTDVRDEPAQSDYYVFSLKTRTGQLRQLKVHQRLFIFSELVTRYLREHDLAVQLERGDVEIAEPLQP